MTDTLHREAAAPWPDHVEGKTWSPRESASYCEAVADAYAGRIPGLRVLLDSEYRSSISALFAFVHRASEFADDPLYEGRRLECIERWEAMLIAAFHGQAQHPVFVGLRTAVEQHDIPITELQSLLDGHRMDLAHDRFRTFAEYRAGCERSAEPVGRLLLRVLGESSPRVLKYSDALCVGLKIADDLRDLREDAAKGLVHLPIEDLEHFDVAESELGEQRPTDGLRALMAFEACRARSFLLRGRPLLEHIRPELRPRFEALVGAGMRFLHRLDE